MRGFILLCLILAFGGCQPASQQNTANVQNENKEASKKFFAQAMMLLHQQDVKGAVQALQAAIQADPTDPNSPLMMGQILLKAGQYEQAADFLDQTAKNFPNNGTVFYMLSVANKMADKTLPAVLAARRSFEIFNAAGDVESAKLSAVLVEELVMAAQQEQSNKEKAEQNKK